MDDLVKLILEDVLKNGGNIRLFKVAIQSKASGETDFENYFQNLINLNQIFNSYRSMPSQAGYEELCQSVELCKFSISWIEGILNKANLPIITLGNSDKNSEKKDHNDNLQEHTKTKIIHQSECNEGSKSTTKCNVDPVTTRQEENNKTTETTIPNHPQVKNKFCRYCGKLISANQQFCRNCGKPL